MKRREFIVGLGGAAAAWPMVGRAQQLDRVRRIGILTNLPETDPEGRVRIQAFRDGLKQLGWIEGQNIGIEIRSYAANPERARAYAAELVAIKPDVILAAPSSALAALQRETRDIPVVFAQVGDPVANGFVDSLAHPGGNITGFATTEFTLGAKWVELLKQIAPSISRACVFYDPANPSAVGYLPSLEGAARRFDIRISTTAVHNADEIQRTIEDFASEPEGALIPIASALVTLRRDLVISLATRFRLPTVHAYRTYPASGGLASYGVDNIDTYRRAASYADRLLKGEKPSDLPVQLPTKFELVINLRTAKALGLTVPHTLLARADEVIE